MQMTVKQAPRRPRMALVLALSLAAVLGPQFRATVQADLIDHQIMMTSYDTATHLLAGIDRNGLPVAVFLLGTTRYRAAQVDKYTPGDPCTPLAGAYNTVQASGSVDVSLQTAIATLAASSCGAKVNIDSSTGVARAFQPVPL